MMCDRTITIKLVCSEDFSPHKIRGLKSSLRTNNVIIAITIFIFAFPLSLVALCKLM